MSCTSISNLTLDLTRSCDPLGQGLYEKIYVVRNIDISAVPMHSTKNKVATAITLRAGKFLKRWEGYKLSSQATVGFESQDSGNKMPHGFNFVVLDNSPEADEEVDRIVSINDLVVIAKQNGATGRWKMFGYPSGLSVTNLSSDSNDAANPGVYSLSFLAAQANSTPLTLQHLTATVDDTTAYLETLAVTV